VIGFLLSTGYDADNIAGNLACVFAVGVRLFPPPDAVERHARLIGRVHLAFAALLFLTLIHFRCSFTKTD
jgi:hypothetical protein